MMKKLSYKYCSERITTHDNGNVQSYDQRESKLNSTSSTDSDAHTRNTWLNNDKKVHSIRIT